MPLNYFCPILTFTVKVRRRYEMVPNSAGQLKKNPIQLLSGWVSSRNFDILNIARQEKKMASLFGSPELTHTSKVNMDICLSIPSTTWSIACTRMPASQVSSVSDPSKSPPKSQAIFFCDTREKGKNEIVALYAAT